MGWNCEQMAWIYFCLLGFWPVISQAVHRLPAAVHITDSACTGSISSTEFNALQILFNSTGGSSWNWNPDLPVVTHWNFPASILKPCSIPWQGLNCSLSLSGKCSISGVILPAFNLTGTIPTSLFDLTVLRSLDLSLNRLGGTIPVGFHRLSNIEYVSLNSNGLTGSIPSDLFSCSGLRSLALHLNRFASSVPSQIGQLVRLEVLEIYSNRLFGPLPAELGSLSLLHTLSAFDNMFTGTIPRSLVNMTSLEVLELYVNELEGTFPVEVVELTNLRILDLDNNYLTSTIPSLISQLTRLVLLASNLNSLTGSLPSQLYTMSLLNLIALDSNHLTGIISADIASLKGLLYLYLNLNYLTGSIPPEFGELNLFLEMQIPSNILSGSIPSALGQLSTLMYLTLCYNIFTTAIPSELGSISTLQAMYLEYSCLTGSIPSELALIRPLRVLQLFGNSLTGTIPSELGQLNQLQYFDINSNIIVGPIPQELGNCVGLQYFDLHENLLTGVLPSDWKLRNVLLFSVEGNLITGSIPNSVSELNASNVISLASNLFTGAIPESLQHLSLLMQLNVSNNRLEGHFHINHTAGVGFPQLQSLDVSSNVLSGTLASELFSLSMLSALVMFDNCFHGTIPDSICESNAQTLILDGLSSGSGCRVRVPYPLNHLIQGVLPLSYLGGTIPSCVWSLKHLSTLHLSGNGLTGTLWDPAQPSVLVDVNLGSNNLQGTIPTFMQARNQFQQLDLSCNKLSGTLQSDYNIPIFNDLIDLTVNRLSGPIPAAFMTSANVNILNGNLFQCESNNMPQNDPGRTAYVCGSFAFDIAMVTWLCLFFIVASIAIYMLWTSSQNCRAGLGRVYDRFRNYSVFQASDNLYWTQLFFFQLRQCCVGVALLVTGYVLIAFTFYLVIKSSASQDATHSVQYLWLPSAAFLRGVAPTVILVIILLASLVSLRIVLSSTLNETEILRRKTTRLYQDNESVTRIQRWCVLGVIHSVNILLALLVNVCYVLAVLGGYDSVSLFFIQFGMGAYKICWNSVVIPTALSFVPFLRASSLLKHRIFMALFVMLAGPLLAILFTHPNCLKFAMVKNTPIESTFSESRFKCTTACGFPGCVTLCGMDLSSPITVDTSVYPPWIYSYQCSSSVITAYVPILVLSYMLTGVILPFFTYVFLARSPQFWETNFSDTILSYLRGPAVFSLSPVYSPSRGSPSVDKQQQQQQQQESSIVQRCLGRQQEQPVMDAGQAFTKMMLSLTVLITFGLSCPILAVVQLVDSIVFVGMRWYVVNRYLELSGQYRRRACQSLEEATSHASEGLGAGARILVAFVCLYWCLLLFDMIGDVYSGVVGGIVVVVFFGAAVTCFVFAEYYSSIESRGGRGLPSADSNLQGMEQELQSSPMHGSSGRIVSTISYNERFQSSL